MGDKQHILSGLSDQWTKTPQHIREELSQQRFNKLRGAIDAFLDLSHENIQDVVDKMLEAVCVLNPEYYYRIGSALEKVVCISGAESAPEEIVDLTVANPKLVFKLLRRFQSAAAFNCK